MNIYGPFSASAISLEADLHSFYLAFEFIFILFNFQVFKFFLDLCE